MSICCCDDDDGGSGCDRDRKLTTVTSTVHSMQWTSNRIIIIVITSSLSIFNQVCAAVPIEDGSQLNGVNQEVYCVAATANVVGIRCRACRSKLTLIHRLVTVMKTNS